VLVFAVALTLLHGIVHIGPTTPVCQVGTPCDKPAGSVVLTFTRAGSTRRVRTDAEGRYSLSLAAGTWHVRASTGMRITPTTFVVPRASSARRDFAIDTGIR